MSTGRRVSPEYPTRYLASPGHCSLDAKRNETSGDRLMGSFLRPHRPTVLARHALEVRMFEKPALISFAQSGTKPSAHHVQAVLADFRIVPEHRTGSGGALLQLGAMFGGGGWVMNGAPRAPDHRAMSQRLRSPSFRSCSSSRRMISAIVASSRCCRNCASSTRIWCEITPVARSF